ncbi:MAG: phosphoadenosine phosphosulfate reductase family protein [Deltaproteobacteria bacterium]|nr:phosphoadenosine phosphosulfate reductase family protein [Deltaproteobacteria bacterium]
MQNIVVDAAGNIPKPLTIFEKKWRESVGSGDIKERMTELAILQALPLSEKIALTETRIRCWHESFNGKVAVSFSGGKDSSVLLWLVRRLFPDVPAVFCNTGLEYPEVVKHVMSHDNVMVMRPKMPFRQVLEKYGFPLVSKKVARGISVLRNHTAANQNIYRLYDQGINRFGEQVNGFKVADRWRFLVDAPFNCSDKCCQIMKKEPMTRYTKLTGYKSFVGTMATDSKAREKVYLQHGCNGYDMKDPKSMPLGFWKEQDVLQALVTYNIAYPTVYGRILRRDNGELYCTGVKRTGCVFCMFAMHMESAPNRFQKLYHSHPRLHSYCMDKLGLGDVIKYVRENCPDKSVVQKFSNQITLF